MHHPSINDANDFEQFDDLQTNSIELQHCSTIFAVDFSIVTNSVNASNDFNVTKRGLTCRGSRERPCPDYQIRYCCSKKIFSSRSISSCGITYNSPNVRIVNGIISNPHSFPWAVSLEYRGMHDCGGSILDQWHILTAAHCLDYANDLGNYFVRVGAHNRSSSGQVLPTRQLILHPKYDEQRSTNDIGIIKLAAPISFSNQIQPICLVDQIVEPALGTTAFIAGWGTTIYQNAASVSQVLRQAQLRVISDCSMYFAYDSQKQICAASNGPQGQDHGSCQGDSGGALVYSKNGRWFAGGVVSYAIGCGRVAFPTVFTKTSAYIDWIRGVINQ